MARRSIRKKSRRMRSRSKVLMRGKRRVTSRSRSRSKVLRGKRRLSKKSRNMLRKTGGSDFSHTAMRDGDRLSQTSSAGSAGSSLSDMGVSSAPAPALAPAPATADPQLAADVGQITQLMTQTTLSNNKYMLNAHGSQLLFTPNRIGQYDETIFSKIYVPVGGGKTFHGQISRNYETNVEAQPFTALCAIANTNTTNYRSLTNDDYREYEYIFTSGNSPDSDVNFEAVLQKISLTDGGEIALERETVLSIEGLNHEEASAHLSSVGMGEFRVLTTLSDIVDYLYITHGEDFILFVATCRDEIHDGKPFAPVVLTQ